MTDLSFEVDQSEEATSVRPSFFNRLYSLVRFPYRGDSLFSVIFFGTLFIPLTFFSYLGDGYETPKLSLWLILGGIALLIAIKRRKVLASLPRELYIVLCLFMVSTVLSTIFSLDIINSALGLYTRFTSGLLFYSLWVLWIVIIYKSLNDQKLEFLFKTLNFSGLLVSVLGLLQQQEIAFYAGVAAQTRSLAPSFLGNPNFSSMYLVALVPIALYCFYNSKKVFSKYFYGTSAVLMIWAIMGFSSRGAILGLAVSLAVFAGLFLWKQRSWFNLGSMAVMGVVTTLLFIGFFSANRPGNIAKTIALNEDTVSFRFFAWGDTADIIKTYPWFGTGHANYYIGFKELGDSALATGERFDDAHNLYFHMIATGGIPFAILFALILALAIAYGITAYKNPTYEKQAIALLAGLAGWMVVVGFNPVTIGCWLVLAFLLAGLFYVRYNSQVPAVITKTWRSILACIVAGLFILYGLILITSEAVHFHGLKAYRYDQYEKAEKLLQFVVYINPNNTGALSYLAATRIKQQQDPMETDHIISFMTSLHPKSSGIWQTADTLYYMLYRQTNNHEYKDKAYESMRQAEQREPNFANILGHQAYLYFKFGDHETSRRYVNHTLSIADSHFYTWLLSAQLYKDAGQKEQMLYCIKKAIVLQPDILLFKVFYDQAVQTSDISTLTIPINFADPNMQ